MRDFSCLLIKRIGLFFIAFILFLPAITKAQTSPAADLESFSSGGTSLYDPNGTQASCTTDGLGGASVGPAVAAGGAWQSGLQPPYILEQFAIETLKDVAKKMGTTPDVTVTQEHVIALLAFMNGEGGDINNQDLFNPLNTGLNDPALIDGAHRGNGVQSFKSFDAGVEATARTLTGSLQSRLAAVLVEKDSTAQQFMTTLTYYNRYPGNAPWAEASMPPHQDSYYNERLQLIQTLRSHYADIAGLQIGTPQKEQLLNLTDKSKLVYHPSVDTSNLVDAVAAGGTGISSCGSDVGVIQGNVVATALNLAWTNQHHGKTESDAKPTYQAAMPKFNGSTGDDEWSDCGVFVSTVMIASGADKDYPKRGTGIQKTYLDNHPEKYKSLGIVKSTSAIQAGDILISSSHTYMFVGSQADGFNSVSASLHDHVPQAGNFYDDGFYGYRNIK